MHPEQKEFSVNSIRICLAQKEPELRGTICAVALEEDVAFSGTRDMIVKIDKVFDRIGQPQPHQVIRTFQRQKQGYKPYNGAPARYHTGGEIAARQGDYHTVDLVMLSRHHAEWQGLIKETDGSVLCRFQSTLEFIAQIERL